MDFPFLTSLFHCIVLFQPPTLAGSIGNPKTNPSRVSDTVIKDHQFSFFSGIRTLPHTLILNSVAEKNVLCFLFPFCLIPKWIMKSSIFPSLDPPIIPVSNGSRQFLQRATEQPRKHSRIEEAQEKHLETVYMKMIEVLKEKYNNSLNNIQHNTNRRKQIKLLKTWKKSIKNIPNDGILGKQKLEICGGAQRQVSRTEHKGWKRESQAMKIW